MNKGRLNDLPIGSLSPGRRASKRKAKEEVERRASKGRKIRFRPIEKLQNFMAGRPKIFLEGIFRVESREGRVEWVGWVESFLLQLQEAISFMGL